MPNEYIILFAAIHNMNYHTESKIDLSTLHNCTAYTAQKKPITTRNMSDYCISDNLERLKVNWTTYYDQSRISVIYLDERYEIQ